MPVTAAQKALAQAAQRAAARDASPQVRLIAGPGTGKSFTIEERVSWLLQTGVDPANIFAISFTNASAQDLRARISRFCEQHGQNGGNVSVTTMHSLALKMLRIADLLQRFPASPLVLDQWEIDSIFDDEFCAIHGIGVKRARHIRRNYEAYWNTGYFNPPNYIPPNPPVSDAERHLFATFSNRFGQIYSCILPGAIVRECVEQMEAGLVAPLEVVPIRHLIVDEYQDLNPMDLNFVRAITTSGAVTFVAGDDDQSIYSFRNALPRGIQVFPTEYPNCGQHSLDQCFRCTTSVLAAATSLLGAHPSTGRIPKQLQSVYLNSVPLVGGTVHRWTFTNALMEARAIAQSCQSLIAAGMAASKILILISDRDLLESTILGELTIANVPFETGDQDYLSETEGRVLYDLIRIVCNPNDYIAHRSLFTHLSGIGVGTCIKISEKVAQNNLNYRDLFYQPLPQGVFLTRETNAIQRVAQICTILTQWKKEHTLQECSADIVLAAEKFGDQVRAAVTNVFAHVPAALTVSEFREVFTTKSDEMKHRILTEAYHRMSVEPPLEEAPVSKVRVMTMHGAKGLSARVVFVPGLEEQVFPGLRRQPYPGLIEEAARLLYVSITRAQIACILSFARMRRVYGYQNQHAPSRFNTATGGGFVAQTSSLTPAQVAQILADSAAF